MPLVLLLLLLPVAVIALMPLILIQRYRVGTARRLARPWMATLALVAMAFSTVFFLITSAVTTIWVANAFTAAVIGLGMGCLLGAAGLALTRWEATPRALHYTPNRLLVLVVTFVVSARVLYGLYRSWAAAQAGIQGADVVTAFGVAESLGAGAIVIGYYLAYNTGLRWRIRNWQRRALRPM